ncbi:MAG: hypothetical protein M3Q76_13825 [Acidobacteriota bacterium]|nr:hypothetical protein [Acidobacteriota bacterium]
MHTSKCVVAADTDRVVPENENFWSTTYFFLGWWNRAENTASNTTAYGKSLEFFGF